jgi:F-type H+-transporting ATPase subunit alpha
MAKEPLKTSLFTDDLRNMLPEDALRPVITEIGEIIYVGDGICKIRGLPTAHIEDVVEIQTKIGQVNAMILGISPESIEAVVLGDYTPIRQGDVVRSRGEVMKIQAGDQMLGRVINVLGVPLDGLGPIKSNHWQQVERLAPGVAKREPVTQQLESGVLVVDTIVPLGKGQRELVVGDRKSGKTKLMASMIMNQKGRNMYCIYVAIGAQKAKIRALEEELRAGGAMDYTCIVLGSSDDSPSLNYIAPYVGCAIGEYYMYSGRDALVIYDDLSKHAKAYRQMSLLLKRSPGRDAYPGDIFYLHSRLLERTARVNEKAGGGSLTGFPMAETQNGDLSEYICTNLMSITDGHIFLDLNLMHEGILPAVNSGASVSRIGGGVQPPCLRKTGELAGSQIARYQEVKSFETLNTEISEETEREIKRGKRILEIFAQNADTRLLNDEKIILMYLVTAGNMDNIDIPDIRKIKEELIVFYQNGDYPEYRTKCTTEKDLGVLKVEIDKIVKDYIAFTKIEGAKFLQQDKPAEEKPMPIVPDTSADVAPGEKKPKS